jgi:hypothetical protein
MSVCSDNEQIGALLLSEVGQLHRSGHVPILNNARISIEPVARQIIGDIVDMPRLRPGRRDWGPWAPSEPWAWFVARPSLKAGSARERVGTGEGRLQIIRPGLCRVGWDPRDLGSGGLRHARRAGRSQARGRDDGLGLPEGDRGHADAAGPS